MQYRIGRRGQQFILVVGESEARSRKIAAEYPDPGREMFAKGGKIKMQLQGMPQPALRFVVICGSNEKVQRFAVLFEKPRRQIRSNIAGRACEKDGHVAQALVESNGGAASLSGR